uniref:Ig-like domain-containing protein n=1 Tax=Astyanax mexicanus TaxID=7994 RepID=W5K9Y0_ASTMX
MSKTITKLLRMSVPSTLPVALFSTVSARFRVVVPEAPVSSVPGSDVVLSCSVREFDNRNIMVNAVDLTVTWSRSDLKDSLVHLYENHKDLNTGQNPSYRGRTAVFKEELKNGDVSLKLSNVRVSDEGEYRCRVDSTTCDKTIKLSVEGKLFLCENNVSTIYSFFNPLFIHISCISINPYYLQIADRIEPIQALSLCQALRSRKLQSLVYNVTDYNTP